MSDCFGHFIKGLLLFSQINDTQLRKLSENSDQKNCGLILTVIVRKLWEKFSEYSHNLVLVQMVEEKLSGVFF